MKIYILSLSLFVDLIIHEIHCHSSNKCDGAKCNEIVIAIACIHKYTWRLMLLRAVDLTTKHKEILLIIRLIPLKRLSEKLTALPLWREYKASLLN